MTGLARSLWLSTLAVLAPGSARAGASGAPVELEVEAVETVTAPPETSSLTVIELRDAAPEARTLPEVLARTAGVHLRRTGGLGAPAAISVRGSSAAQVAVFLDGVPLQRASLGAVDLGRLPLGSLERVELYRGGAPAGLGGQGIGGAINLVTRRPRGQQSTDARVTAGSFLTRQLDLHHGARPGDVEYGVGVHYTGTRGDFTYFDDNATPWNPADDTPAAVRANNGLDQLAADLRAGLERGRLSASLAEHVMVREQGVPSLGSLAAGDARLEAWSALTDLKLAAPAGGLGLELRGDLAVGADTYRSADPVSAADSTYRSLAGGGSLVVRVPAGAAMLSVEPGGRAERLDQDNRLAPDREAHARRVQAGAAAAAEVSLREGALVLDGSARLDWLDTRGLSGRADAVGSAEVATSQLEPTFRAGARAQLGGGLGARASAARRFRPATFYELFGDRGTFVGNERLRPEVGLSWDAGVLWQAGEEAPIRLRAEVTYFETRAEDLIVSLPSQRATRAANVAGATTRGVEATVTARRGPVTLDASYTFLAARDDATGRVVPGRPAHDATLRLESEVPVGAGVALGGAYQLEAVAGAYRDLANTLPMASRVTHDVQLRVRPRRWLVLAFEARNLFDLRQEEQPLLAPGATAPRDVPVAISDFGGYPLPGRAFYGTAEVRL